MTEPTIAIDVKAMIVEASSGYFWAITRFGERRKAANGWMATHDIELVRRVIMTVADTLYGAQVEVHFE